jgi:signal transduction histidine kinase
VNLYHQFKISWLRIPLRHKGAAIITIPIVCLFVFLATSIYLRYYTTAASRYVAHTQDVLLESSSLLVALLNAETGVRGYESVGDQSFLESYNDALSSLPRSSTRLRELVSDNPQQLQRVQIIERGIQQELRLLREAIARAESSPIIPDRSSQKNASLINAKAAKAAMDRLKQEIGDFQAVERQLLKIREQELARQENLRGWAQLGMTVVSILASLGALYLFDRIERDRQEGLRIMRSQAHDLVQLNKVLAHTNVMLGDRNRELDQFAYVASHDLKAPLRAIANLSEWIEEDLEGQASPEVQQHMNLLRKRVHRMEALINGLLDYSRVGRSKVPIETVNVATLLAEVIDSLDPPPTFRIEAKAMPTIQARRLPLSQVFSNLISNAIKHCHRDDGSHRDDGKIWITAQRKDKFYEFAISDNGQGIAPEHQTRIFTIFQTLEPRDKTENTGIGLSIVKKIVETEGGKVWVESEPGKGATFRFTWYSLAIEPGDRGGAASEPMPLIL